MPAFSTFLRCTPPALLQRYLEQSNGPLPHEFNWSAPPAKLVPALVAMIDAWDATSRASVHAEADRIGDMADEGGQTALFSVYADTQALDALGHGYARAVFLYLEHRDTFRRAEEVRFADDGRRSRMWTGFQGEPLLAVSRDAKPSEAFQEEIKTRFESPNTHVEIYDRARPTFGGDPAELVQIVIYREGRLDQRPAFIESVLAQQSSRPVIEAAITYERETGTIEVVGPDVDARFDLVRMFALHFLGRELGNVRSRPRLYDLKSLLRRRDFDRDPHDGIADVHVVMLRLAPHSTGGERITLETTRTAGNDIWAMAAQHFGPHDPLQGGWSITQARLSISLRAGPAGRPGRILPVTISPPQRCDLKDRTEAERMIGAKYLRRWKLLCDG